MVITMCFKLTQFWIGKWRNVNNWESNEYERLLRTLSFVSMDRSNDELVWTLSSIGTFSVRSFYNYLVKNNTIEIIFPFRQIWKVNASLIIFFAWEVGCECIDTIDKLTRRKVMLNGCCLCNRKQSLVTTSCFHADWCANLGQWHIDYWGLVGWWLIRLGMRFESGRVLVLGWNMCVLSPCYILGGLERKKQESFSMGGIWVWEG